MAKTGMNQGEDPVRSHDSMKKLDDAWCTTATIHDYACHVNRCDNTTVHFHGCYVEENGRCYDIQSHLNIYNSTGGRNITLHVHACYVANDDCDNVKLISRYCIFDDCHDRTNHIHACYTAPGASAIAISVASTCALIGADLDISARAYLEASCIEPLIEAVNHLLGGK